MLLEGLKALDRTENFQSCVLFDCLLKKKDWLRFVLRKLWVIFLLWSIFLNIYIYKYFGCSDLVLSTWMTSNTWMFTFSPLIDEFCKQIATQSTCSQQPKQHSQYICISLYCVCIYIYIYTYMCVCIVYIYIIYFYISI